MYDPKTNNWTVVWDAQSSESDGPVARFSSALWIDKDDNKYVYGGQGLEGQLCDFWKFNTSGIWTQLADDEVNYGEKGMPSDNVFPGCLRGVAQWYTKDDNSLWLGLGTDLSQYGSASLWQYSIAIKQWAWVAGANSIELNTLPEPAMSSPNNFPGSRYAPATAVDGEGNLW